MEIDDDIVGLFDDPAEIDLLEWSQSELIIIKDSSTDPMNKDHAQYL